MSKTCGDTARFNRLRKQKIARREKIRALRAAIEARRTAPASNATPAKEDYGTDCRETAPPAFRA